MGDNVSRNVLDVLRDATEPMTLDRIAAGLLAMRGVEPNRRMVRDAAMRGYNALQRYTESGLLRQTTRPDGRQVWEVRR
ncbi:MAG TPA: hypothetical protein VKS60_20410 [Stellaceae bacterium]|nr:hypothetical protein [Stellaceae bacterium]